MITTIPGYNIPIDSSWEYAQLFSSPIRVKYNRAPKGEKREIMQPAEVGLYDKMVTINTTAFLTDAVTETRAALRDYVQNKLFGSEEFIPDLLDYIPTIPAPDVFKCYSGNLHLKTKMDMSVKAPTIAPGKEMERYGRMLNNLINNGYTNA